MKQPNLQKTFGATVTRLRNERKMTVEALSAVTRIWPTRLKGIEAGTAIVTLLELQTLANSLGRVIKIYPDKITVRLRDEQEAQKQIESLFPTKKDYEETAKQNNRTSNAKILQRPRN